MMMITTTTKNPDVVITKQRQQEQEQVQQQQQEQQKVQWQSPWIMVDVSSSSSSPPTTTETKGANNNNRRTIGYNNDNNDDDVIITTKTNTIDFDTNNENSSVTVPYDGWYGFSFAPISITRTYDPVNSNSNNQPDDSKEQSHHPLTSTKYYDETETIRIHQPIGKLCIQTVVPEAAAETTTIIDDDDTMMFSSSSSSSSPFHYYEFDIPFVAVTKNGTKNNTAGSLSSKIGIPPQVPVVVSKKVGKLIYIPAQSIVTVCLNPNNNNIHTNDVAATATTPSYEWCLYYNHHHPNPAKKEGSTSFSERNLENNNYQLQQQLYRLQHSTPYISNEIKSFICTACIRSFVSARAVLNHYNSVHKSNTTTNYTSNNVDNNNKNYMNSNSIGNNCKKENSSTSSSRTIQSRDTSKDDEPHNDDDDDEDININLNTNNNNKESYYNNQNKSNPIWTTPLSVIYQDYYMVIIDKPQGMAVMGSKPSLVRSNLLIPLAGRMNNSISKKEKNHQLQQQQQQQLQSTNTNDTTNSTNQPTTATTAPLQNPTLPSPSIAPVTKKPRTMVGDKNSDEIINSQQLQQSESTSSSASVGATSSASIINTATTTTTKEDRVYTKPRPVHRLDAATGGILVLAKTSTAEPILMQAFANRTVHKRYRAIVIGKVPIPNSDASIQQQQQLLRDNDSTTGSNNNPKGCINIPIGGKNCITYYRIVQYIRTIHTKDQYMTLLDLWPETGRRHQLRRHLQFIGHPIIGDLRYNGKLLNIPPQSTISKPVIRETERSSTTGSAINPNTHNESVSLSSTCDVIDPLIEDNTSPTSTIDLCKSKVSSASKNDGNDSVSSNNTVSSFSRLCLFAMEITLPHPRTGTDETYCLPSNPKWIDTVLETEQQLWDFIYDENNRIK